MNLHSPTSSTLLTKDKITFIFIAVLFLDSVNRVYRVQVELAQAGKTNQAGGGYVDCSIS